MSSLLPRCTGIHGCSGRCRGRAKTVRHYVRGYRRTSTRCRRTCTGFFRRRTKVLTGRLRRNAPYPIYKSMRRPRPTGVSKRTPSGRAMRGLGREHSLLRRGEVRRRRGFRVYGTRLRSRRHVLKSGPIGRRRIGRRLRGVRIRLSQGGGRAGRTRRRYHGVARRDEHRTKGLRKLQDRGARLRGHFMGRRRRFQRRVDQRRFASRRRFHRTGR